MHIATIVQYYLLLYSSNQSTPKCSYWCEYLHWQHVIINLLSYINVSIDNIIYIQSKFNPFNKFVNF